MQFIILPQEITASNQHYNKDNIDPTIINFISGNEKQNN